MTDDLIRKPATSQSATTKYCPGCGKALHISAEACPNCGAKQPSAKGQKDRVLAIVLALLLGGFGVHKFYLGRVGQGILYLIFCWTFIPTVIAFVEAIIYVTMSDEAFCKKYG